MNTSLGSEKGNQRQKGKKTATGNWKKTVTGKVQEFTQTKNSLFKRVMLLSPR